MNVCNDLAEALKALDGKKRLGLPLVRLRCRSFGHREVFEPGGADRLDTYCMA